MVYTSWLSSSPLLVQFFYSIPRPPHPPIHGSACSVERHCLGSQELGWWAHTRISHQSWGHQNQACHVFLDTKFQTCIIHYLSSSLRQTPSTHFKTGRELRSLHLLFIGVLLLLSVCFDFCFVQESQTPGSLLHRPPKRSVQLLMKGTLYIEIGRQTLEVYFISFLAVWCKL